VQTNDLKTISDTISTALSLEARRPSSFNPSLRDRISAMTKVRPALLKEPPPQHGRSWTCPKTGIVIPKTLTENLEWRSKILAEAKMDDGLQAQLRAACAASPLFWFNAFAYTYRPKMVGADGATVQLFGHDTHVPFITWLVQDEAIELLVNCIRDGKDAAIDKSRDMGASWLCLGVFHWFWQFGESFTAMELSRKEEYVDKKGEMDTLFRETPLLAQVATALALPAPRHRQLHEAHQPRPGQLDCGRIDQRGREPWRSEDGRAL
jgi:ABC-type glycerol-3-phosphate transport system substrate-binding protein